MATGSRELGALDPLHLVSRVDAILLAGGSAFGLSCADGVMTWLSERGRGYDTGVALVPIVPAAVIFDLHATSTRPDGETGSAACDNARDGMPDEGRVGAGLGATVGKIAGTEGAMPGGVGAFAADLTIGGGAYRVGALAVVNALGDVLDAGGRIVAGARGPDGAFLDTAAVLRRGADGTDAVRDVVAGTHTTLAVVGTDAPLTRVDLQRLARMAGNAFARRISPVHTPFDGDMVFAVSTAVEEQNTDAAGLLALGATAQHALEEAITRAVTHGLTGTATQS